MRSLLLLVPVVLAVAACAAPGDEGDVEMGGVAELNSKGNSCSLSRSKILGSVSGTRRTAIERGFKWLDDNVPYSQSAQHEGYRTDCSGFVSMCWELGTSTNTSAMNGGAYNSKLASFDDLVPADALLKNGHVMMFVGWNDESHSGACVLEQASTASDMQFRVHTMSSLKSGGYKAVRAKKLAGDTTFNPSAGGGDDLEDEVPTPPTKPTKTTKTSGTPSPSPASPVPAACPPPPAVELCSAAFESDGIECGTISDGCGGVVNCNTVQGFGCLAGETCSAQKLCVPSGGGSTPFPTDPTTTNPSCVPMTAGEACGQAKTSSGAECGSVPNGCGGTVSCDAVGGFGCKTGQTCGATNKCQGSGAPATDAAGNAAGTEPQSADANKGDPGAEEEPEEPKLPQSTSAAKKKKSAGGCSAAAYPGSGGGDALPFLGLAFAVGLMRRRSRRDAR